MNNNLKRVIIVAILAIFIGVGWFYFGGGFKKSFAIDKVFLPTEWQYNGLYTNPEQIEKTLTKIEGFQEQKGKTTEEKYDFAITIAQEYMRVGKGEEAYKYLLKAGKIDPVNSITYQTMGNLFVSLGAYDAAEQALKKGIEAQPHIIQNHIALIEYYKKFEKEPLKIENAFTEALDKTNRNTNIAKEYGEWLEEKDRFREALVIWEEIYALTKELAVKEKISQLKRK